MKKKIDYDNWSKDELIKEIKRIKETTYGLVWHRDLPEEKIDILMGQTSPYATNDIVRKYIVEYRNAGFRLDCLNGRFKRAIYKNTMQFLEVIGNIYENPGLLEKIAEDYDTRTTT